MFEEIKKRWRKLYQPQTASSAEDEVIDNGSTETDTLIQSSEKKHDGDN